MTMTTEHQQHAYVAAFLAAAVAFFYFGGEMLARHTSWSDFATPPGVGEIFGLLASVGVVVAAALKIDLGLVREFFGRDRTS